MMEQGETNETHSDLYSQLPQTILDAFFARGFCRGMPVPGLPKLRVP
jgi:hypothetical protein